MSEAFRVCSHGAVRIAHDHLAFKALCVLDEVWDECRRPGPARGTHALRFALAYLYAIGDCERAWFDGFWQAVTDPHVGAHSELEAGIARRAAAGAAINAIARSVGMPLTPALQGEIWRARGKIPPGPNR